MQPVASTSSALPFQLESPSSNAPPTFAADPSPSGLSPAILASIARSRRAIRECIAGAEQDDQALGLAGAPGGVAGGRLLKSCAACRALKVRCSGGDPCPRCVKKGIECQYTERKKLGRKITNPKTKKLYELQAELDRLYALANRSTSFTGADTAAEDSPQSLAEEEEDEDNLFTILTNPLGLLTLDSEPTGDSNQTLNEPAGLFDHVLDADQALDPINLGLLSEGEFERFLTFYFDKLQHYLFLLDPALHTSRYIRRVSPFLTTVVALNSALYDPSAADLIRPLEQHASDLAARSFTYGHRSMEVILAYCLWAPWSPVPETPSSDRTWRNIGQAVRLASEVRLEIPLHPKLVAEYQRLLHPTPLSSALLNQARVRTLELVFCLDVALTSQTGRMHSLFPSTFHATSAHAPSAGQIDIEDTPYFSRTAIQNLHVAYFAMSRSFSKALFLHADMRSRRTGDSSGLRDQFIASWKADFAAWDREFAGVRDLPYLSRLNRHILLLSYSLHFPGPVEPILAECQKIAVEAAKYVCDWFAADPRLMYASNFLLLNLSHPAAFLVRHFPRRTSNSMAVEVDPACVNLCKRIVEILCTIAAARPHGGSLANVHADRLRALLRHDISPPSSAAILPPIFPYPIVPFDSTTSPVLPAPPFFAPTNTSPAYPSSASTSTSAAPAAIPSAVPAPPAAADNLALPNYSWASLPQGMADHAGGIAAGGWEQGNPGGMWATGMGDWDQLFAWLPPSLEEATRPPPP